MLGHIGSFGIPELLLRLMGAEPSAEESDIFGLGGMGGMQLRTMGGQLRFRGGMESSSEEEEPLSSEDNVKWWVKDERGAYHSQQDRDANRR